MEYFRWSVEILDEICHKYYLKCGLCIQILSFKVRFVILFYCKILTEKGATLKIRKDDILLSQ